MIFGKLLKAALPGLFLALVLGSCKKDIETAALPEGESATHFDNGFADYAWTGPAADFFDLGSYKSIQFPGALMSRNNEPASLVYHPDLVGLYNEIAAQNQVHHFVEDIVANAGLPIWRYAQVIEAADGQSTLLIVPLAFDSFPAVTSLITATKSQGGYTINAVSRKELLDTEHGNPRRKLPYAKALAFYDKLLFGTEGDASTAFCEYVRTIEGNPQLDPVPPLPPDGDCEWRIVEVCSDLDAQVSWFNWPGSVSVLPPHLDHDGDGIINDQDQDWHELLLRLEISQEDFTDYVREWWDDNHGPEYGDYDDFWGDYPYPEGGQNLDGLWDDLMDLWQDFWEGFWEDLRDIWQDFWDPDGPGLYAFEDGFCWEDNPLSGGGAVEEREIRCEWYFILDCGEAFNASNWHQVLTHAPCPQCPEFGSYDDLFSGRVKAYYDTHEQAFLPFTSLDGLVQTAELIGCDAFSPGFEQCLNEALLASAFGLSYTNSFTEEAISWLVNTPVYPEGPGRVYTIATYWNSQGNSAGARERIERVVNWIGSVEGLDVDNGQLTWLLSLDDAALTEILDVSYALLEENEYDEASTRAVNLFFDLESAGVTDGPYGDNYYEIYDQQDGIIIGQGIRFAYLAAWEYAIIRKETNLERKPAIALALKNAWDQWLEEFQFQLDVFGLMPGIGEYADLANGVIYTLQGDGFNATLSFASTIPIYGWFTTSAKWASKVVTGASGRSIRLKLIKDGNQVVFSYRGQLAKVITVPPGKHAHHIIPWNKRTDVLVQHAAKGDNFHMNDFNNGIAIENWRNQPNHPIYDSQVQNSLNQIKTNLENQFGTSLENISPNAVASELKGFQDYLKALISNNPNKHLNELSINYP